MIKAKFAKQDFLEENLPQTRKEQFFDLLKNQYKVIFLLGLLLLTFFVPSLVKNCAVDYANNAVYTLLEAGTYTEEQASGTLGFIWIISNASDLVLYPILSVGLAGGFRVLKQLIYGEPVIFGYDFKIGLKDNWKQFVLSGLLIALFKGIMNVVALLFSNIVLAKYGSMLIFALVILPPLLMLLFYVTIYKNTYLKSLKDSTFLYLKSSWRSLLLMIFVIGPFVALELLLNFLWVKQGIYVVLIIFALPLALLICFMFINNMFDSVINVFAYPEIVRKGLYISETEKAEIMKHKKEAI